jgi:uncharacterized membrane protein
MLAIVLFNLAGSFYFVVGLCVLGVLVCLYAINVETIGFGEMKKNRKPSYTQMCDINESISCTLVLTSEYSHMARRTFNLDENSIFNLSNAQYGLIYYVGILFFQFYPFTLIPFHSWLFLLGTIASVLASCGLAFILKYRLHNFCMICALMYVINDVLLACAVMRLINA